MPSYIEKTISAYDQSPDKYVQSTDDMTPPVEFERFVGEVKSKGTSVLDAGCAFGRDSAKFAEVGLTPTGIDLSDELLKRARKRNPGLEFHNMDVRRLRFDDAAFAGIWCNAVLLHLNDQDLESALKEFWRVLKPGGVLFVSVKRGSGTQEVVEKFSSDAARFYNFKTIESLKELLEKTRFLVADCYYINERDEFGPAKRDLEWVHCFAAKP